MCNKQKIVLYTVGFPISCCSTVMLFLDDKLFERKTCVLKNLHDIKAHGEHATLLTCIAHENSTKLTLFQNSVTFFSNRLHLFKEVFDLKLRQIAINAIAVLDYVSVWRVCADKVYAIIGYAIKMSSVSLIDIYLTLCRLIVESCLFTAAFKSNIVYINSDNITAK